MSKKNNYRTYRQGEVLKIIINDLNEGKNNHQIAQHLIDLQIPTYHNQIFTAHLVGVIKKRYVDEKTVYSLKAKKELVKKKQNNIVKVGFEQNNLPV
jgi:hypothetical protein